MCYIWLYSGWVEQRSITITTKFTSRLTDQGRINEQLMETLFSSSQAVHLHNVCSLLVVWIENDNIKLFWGSVFWAWGDKALICAHEELSHYLSLVNGTVLVIFASTVENHCKSARVKRLRVPKDTTAKVLQCKMLRCNICFKNTI